MMTTNELITHLEEFPNKELGFGVLDGKGTIKTDLVPYVTMGRVVYQVKDANFNWDKNKVFLALREA